MRADKIVVVSSRCMTALVPQKGQGLAMQLESGALEVSRSWQIKVLIGVVTESASPMANVDAIDPAGNAKPATTRVSAASPVTRVTRVWLVMGGPAKYPFVSTPASAAMPAPTWE